MRTRLDNATSPGGGSPNYYTTGMLPANNAAWSVAYWVKRAPSFTFNGGYTYPQFVVSTESWTPDYVLGYTGWQTYGWGWGVRGHGPSLYMTTAEQPAVNRWRKYIYTRDNSGAYCYVDGIQCSAGLASGALYTEASYNMYWAGINTNAPDGDHGGWCSFGPMAFWSRALSKTEAIIESANRSIWPVITEKLTCVLDNDIGQETGGPDYIKLLYTIGTGSLPKYFNDYAVREYNPSAVWYKTPWVPLAGAAPPPPEYVYSAQRTIRGSGLYRR